jgi:hypothetical protein
MIRQKNNPLTARTAKGAEANLLLAKTKIRVRNHIEKQITARLVRYASTEHCSVPLERVMQQIEKNHARGAA